MSGAPRSVKCIEISSGGVKSMAGENSSSPSDTSTFQPQEAGSTAESTSLVMIAECLLEQEYEMKRTSIASMLATSETVKCWSSTYRAKALRNDQLQKL